MKSKISPGVAAVIIVVAIAVVLGLGYKMTVGNIPAAPAVPKMQMGTGPMTPPGGMITPGGSPGGSGPTRPMAPPGMGGGGTPMIGAPGTPSGG